MAGGHMSWQEQGKNGPGCENPSSLFMPTFYTCELPRSPQFPTVVREPLYLHAVR